MKHTRKRPKVSVRRFRWQSSLLISTIQMERAVMTANEMEFEKLLKIMLLDEDPGAREEIAMIIEFFCLGTDLEDSE